MARIRLFNSLYERMHPDEKIETYDECYKYLMYRTAFKSFSIVVADTIKSGEVAGNNCKSVEDLTKDSGYISHGNFRIYDFHSSQNADGSVSIKLSLSTSKKTATEITVFDNDGNVYGDRQYLSGQRDPSSVPQIFIKTGKGFVDLAKGKFAGADAEFNNSKNTFTVKIALGGCIRITDDAQLMNNDPIANVGKEALVTGVNLLWDSLNDFEVIKGNKIKNSVGFNVGKDMISNITNSNINDTNMNTSDYALGIGTSLADSYYSKIVDLFLAGKNPAGGALKAVEYSSVKLNSVSEAFAIENQEKKTNGYGAIIIYP